MARTRKYENHAERPDDYADAEFGVAADGAETPASLGLCNCSGHDGGRHLSDTGSDTCLNKATETVMGYDLCPLCAKNELALETIRSYWAFWDEQAKKKAAKAAKTN